MDIRKLLPIISILSVVRTQTTNGMSMDWGMVGGSDPFGPLTTPSMIPTTAGGVGPSMMDNGAQGGTGRQANQGDWFSLGVDAPQFSYHAQTTKRPTSTAFPPLTTTFKSNFLPMNSNAQYSAQNPRYNVQSFSAKSSSFSAKPNSQIQIYEKPSKMSFSRQNSRMNAAAKPAPVVSSIHQRNTVQQLIRKPKMAVPNSFSHKGRNTNSEMNRKPNNRVGSQSGWTDQTNQNWNKPTGAQQQPVQRNTWNNKPQSADVKSENSGSANGWQAMPNQDNLKSEKSNLQRPKYQAQTFKDLRVSSNTEFKMSNTRPRDGERRNQFPDRSRGNNNYQNERPTSSDQSKGRQRIVMVSSGSNTKLDSNRFPDQRRSDTRQEQSRPSLDRPPPVQFSSSMKQRNDQKPPRGQPPPAPEWKVIAQDNNNKDMSQAFIREPPRRERQVNSQNWPSQSEQPLQQQLLDKPPDRSPVLSQPVHRQRISNQAETNSQPQHSRFQMPPSPPSNSYQEPNQQQSNQQTFQQPGFQADNQPTQQMPEQQWDPQIQQQTSLSNDILQKIQVLLNQQQDIQKMMMEWQQNQLSIQKQQQMLQSKNVQATNRFSNTISGMMTTFKGIQTGIDKMQTTIGKFLAAV